MMLFQLALVEVVMRALRSVLAFGLVFCTVEAQAADPCSLATVLSAPQVAVDGCTAALSQVNQPPRIIEMHGLRARAHQRLSDFEAAADDLDAALALKPRDADLIMKRAHMHARLGDYKAFVISIQKALDIDPMNADALQSLGAVYSNMGKDEQALVYYAAALKSDPEQPWVLLNRPKSLIRLQRFDEALKDLSALAEHASASLDAVEYHNERGVMRNMREAALVDRAELHWTLGRIDQAEADTEAALKVKETPEAFDARGYVRLYFRGRASDALEDAKSALALDGADPEAWRLRGDAELHLGRYEDAVTSFNKSIEQGGSSPEGIWSRSVALARGGKLDRAVLALTEEIEGNPVLLRQTMFRLVSAKYWSSHELPSRVTPSLSDAVKACLLDPKC